MVSQPLLGRHSTYQEHHLLMARIAWFTPVQGNAAGDILTTQPGHLTPVSVCPGHQADALHSSAVTPSRVL